MKKDKRHHHALVELFNSSVNKADYDSLRKALNKSNLTCSRYDTNLLSRNPRIYIGKLEIKNEDGDIVFHKDVKERTHNKAMKAMNFEILKYISGRSKALQDA